MGQRKSRRGRALLALLALASVAAPASSQRGGSIAALNKIQPGLWQLRVLGREGAKPAALCLSDPAVLAQLQHRSQPCSRLVVAQDGTGATVHYTCQAGGYGQTSLRIETPRLVQIDTQGILDNVPFAYRAEARFAGACGGPRTAGR
jgi:hypothetical protein